MKRLAEQRRDDQRNARADCRAERGIEYHAPLEQAHHLSVGGAEQMHDIDRRAMRGVRAARRQHYDRAGGSRHQRDEAESEIADRTDQPGERGQIMCMWLDAGELVDRLNGPVECRDLERRAGPPAH